MVNKDSSSLFFVVWLDRFRLFAWELSRSQNFRQSARTCIRTNGLPQVFVSWKSKVERQKNACGKPFVSSFKFMTRWEMVLHVENTWLKVKTSSGFVDFSLFVVCLFMYFDGFIKLFKILSPHAYFAYYKACDYRRRWAIINLNVAVVNFTSSMFPSVSSTNSLFFFTILRRIWIINIVCISIAFVWICVLQCQSKYLSKSINIIHDKS